MEYTQAMVTPAAAHRDLMRLLPQFRDGVDAALARLQEVGHDPLAIEGVRTVLQRLQSGFWFLAIPELERLAEEIDAAVGWLGDALADPYAEPQYCQDLRSGILHVMLGWNGLLEGVAAGHEPLTELAEAIDALRRARGAPRYDSLALLRHCVDTQAPRSWLADPSDRANRARWPYQLGLLELLRGDECRGLNALQSILEPLERALGDSAAGGACWLALGVIEALLDEGGLEVADKRSLVAFDRELRRLTRGGNTAGKPATSMLEVMLNRVSAAPGVAGRIAELKHAVARFPRTELALPPLRATGAGADQTVLPAAVSAEDEVNPELQELFYEEVEPALAQLGTVLKRWRYGDVQAGLTIQRILHDLQRSSRFAGLQGFAEHCREIEHEVATALADGFDQQAAERLRISLESLAEELDKLSYALRGRTGLPVGKGGKAEGDKSGDSVPGEAIAAGVRQVQPQLLGVLKLIFDRLLASIEQAAAEYDRALELEVVSADGRFLADSAGLVGDALEPLVVNAVIHGVESVQRRLRQGKPGRGTIRLRAWHDHGELLITVSDDGGGLDLQGLQRQLSDYDPEELAAPLNNDEALSLLALPGVSLLAEEDLLPRPGEGVGLASQAARELGGLLEVETVPGSGTTFTLRLPAAVLAANAPDAMQESPEVERQRALIVNDSRTLRRITAYLLGYDRFTLLEANSLAEAVMLARSHEPDVVVMDVQMGWGEAGLDSLRRLEDEAGVPVKRVVAVSTRERDRQRLEERDMQPAALLIEPYAGEELEAAVARALQCRAELSSNN